MKSKMLSLSGETWRKVIRVPMKAALERMSADKSRVAGCASQSSTILRRELKDGMVKACFVCLGEKKPQSKL
jgi:hypothetical protein